MPAGAAGRKAMHVAAAIAAAIVLLSAPQDAARVVFVVVAAVAIGIDAARRHPAVRPSFQRWFGRWLRPAEDRRLTGATTLAIGFAAAVLIFPPSFAATGILVAGLADPAAAFVGSLYGRRWLRHGKTLEGGAAFFVTALAIGVALPFIAPAPAILTAAVAAIVEAASARWDDNYVLPPAAAGAAWAASILIG